MRYLVRRRLAVVLLTLAGALMAAGAFGLHDFGGFDGLYGRLFNQVTVFERHIPSAVTAVVFDYRGFDTLGEELILLAAVAGVALLLRELRQEEEEPPEEAGPGRDDYPASAAMQAVGLILTGVGILFGCYLVLSGHLSPGGGFQGGATIAGAVALLYLVGSYELLHGLFPVPPVEALEAIGAGGYVIVALGGLAAGATFMQNVLPLGQEGRLLSGGTILVLSIVVGLAVVCGFLLLVLEFLHQTLTVRKEAGG